MSSIISPKKPRGHVAKAASERGRPKQGEIILATNSFLGRPTKYKPEYCQQVIDFMSKGYSLTAFAGNILVAFSTIQEWEKAHEAFSAAIKIGKAARTGILEKELLEKENGPQVTARIFALKNAAPDEWREKVEHDVNLKIDIAQRIQDGLERRRMLLLEGKREDGEG